MSQDERLEYLATTKDKGNKRYVVLGFPFALLLRLINCHLYFSLDFRFAH